MTPIRILIVDDEPLARQRLRSLLAAATDVEVIAEAGDGPSAVAQIERSAPDLVFLDVQMPELDGFDVVARVGPARMPPVVFVTAFDAYALRAFEVHALDYLLKPFDEDRFAQMLDHVRTSLRRDAVDGLAKRLDALLAAHGERPVSQHLLARAPGRVRIVRVDEIDWIAAAGNYIEVHAGRETHLVHETLTAAAQRLPRVDFRRIHRSTIVRLDRVIEVHAGFRGDGAVVLRDGTRLAFSRRYRDELRELLEEA